MALRKKSNSAINRRSAASIPSQNDIILTHFIDNSYSLEQKLLSMPDSSSISVTVLLASLIFIMLSNGKSLKQVYSAFSRRGTNFQLSRKLGDNGTSFVDSWYSMSFACISLLTLTQATVTLLTWNFDRSKDSRGTALFCHTADQDSEARSTVQKTPNVLDIKQHKFSVAPMMEYTGAYVPSTIWLSLKCEWSLSALGTLFRSVPYRW